MTSASELPSSKRIPSRRLSFRSRREIFAGYLFIAPATIGYFVFFFLPIVAVLVLSLLHYGVFSAPTFAGFSNFLQMLSDQRLRLVLGNTIVFSVFAVVGNVGIGLALAIAINRPMSGFARAFFRSAFFAPALIGLVFVAVIWQFLFTKDIGIINYYLRFLGIGPIGWLSDPKKVLSSIIFLDIWKNAGMAMLICLAGLQGIANHYYEVAAIEGAGPWTVFMRITLPMLSPTLFFVITLYMIGALRVFDSIVVLTNGGPGDSSRSLVMYLYETGFRQFEYGYASAISMLLLGIVGILTFAQFRLSRLWVQYGD